jgi:hypothetical protein
MSSQEVSATMIMAKQFLAVSMLAMTALGGCMEATYLYQPTELATASQGGRAAARYLIPADAPEGEVRVATFGITALQIPGRKETPAVHVRLFVANDSGDATWTLDASDLLLAIPGSSALTPAFVKGPEDGISSIGVAPGTQRVIDVFYTVPRSVDIDDLPGFVLTWRIQTEASVVAERTAFVRTEIDLGPSTAWRLGAFWPARENGAGQARSGGSGSADAALLRP